MGIWGAPLGCDFFERRGEKRIDVGTVGNIFFRMVSYAFFAGGLVVFFISGYADAHMRV